MIKVIANLGKLDEERTALIIDNTYFPYYIVNGWNGEMEGDNLWAWTVSYFDNIMDFAKEITAYGTEKIGYKRMSDIAAKAIDGLFMDGAAEAQEYCEETLELNDDECKYFGV